MGLDATEILRVEGVSFAHFDGPPVLRDVNLAINRGDRIALLGANGAGKSTLFRLLAGAWKPTEGRVLLDDTAFSYSRKGRDAVRRRVQLVLQEPDDQLFAMTVAADVSYGPVNQGLVEDEVRARVDAAMDAAEISDLAERVPHQLSYGQRKRVALAGALAMRPEVLLLDEPTAGLDPAGGRQLLRTLERLHEQGTAVVLSTHDVNLAYAFSETAAVIHDGQVVVGPKEDILGDAALMRTARLELPWAPAVSAALGRVVSRPEELIGEG